MLGPWWRERTPRERWILGAAGAVVLLSTVYLGLEPVLEERARLAREIPRMQADLAWMRSKVGTIKELRQSGEPAPAEPGRVTPAMVQEAVRRAGLQEELTSLGATGEGRVRLALGGVAFAELTELLQRLRRSSGIRVARARIQRQEDQPGMVDADLTLAGEGAS